MRKPLAALILAAGRGERMNSDRLKVLHEAAGEALLVHVLEAVRGAGASRVGVVAGSRRDFSPAFFRGIEIIEQKHRLGTGHAVFEARRRFGSWPGDLL